LDDPFFTDIRLSFARDGTADLMLDGPGAGAVSGVDNLVQALTLRLLIDRGELAGLGHPRYGTRIRALLGETLDRANLELLRRYVRRSLMDDPRVADVVSIVVTPRDGEPDAVDVAASVVAVSGAAATLQVTLNA